MTYEIFQDNDKKWRWRSISASGHVFISEKIYEQKIDCERDIDKIKKSKVLLTKTNKKVIKKSFWRKIVDKIQNTKN
jgi:uncharacterized protein YegP (UPF0339 family)